MLRLNKFQAISVLLVSIISLYLAAPSFISSEILPDTKVNLGLDLKGGVSLLFQVESESYYKDLFQGLIDKIRNKLKSNHIDYSNFKVSEFEISMEFQKNSNKTQLEKAKDISKSVCGQIIDVKYCNVNIVNDFVTIIVPQNFRNETQKKLLEQSISIIQRRIDETGTKEIDIQRQGENHILLQVPGTYDTDVIKRLVGKTAKLTFHLVNHQISAKEIENRIMPFGTKLLPLVAQKTYMIPVEIKPSMSGDMLIDAQPNTHMGGYVVQFKLNNWGAKIFAELTSNNVGKAFAIVLDNKVISAPVIRDVIPTGSGIISGNFSLESAAELAILLRSGALPTKLDIVEERTVGPTLGQASIRAGALAVIVSSIAVVLFMIGFYGILGFFADIALILNVVMIFAVLGVLGATLTMPGIAGIALTLGMAVDANVLIFERMKEEKKKGKSLIMIVENGYNLALRTILDSNITTIIASVVLYCFGSGPVRGFAVSLTIGIICSMFTAIVLTKVLTVIWFNIRKNNVSIL